MKIYTIGYQSCEISEFVQFLSRNKIARIVDVRKNPSSRKRGFSKNKLAEQLATKAIEYLHLPSLGVPSEWRKMAKIGQITREKMFQDYVKKILPVAEADIDLIAQMMREKNTSLLCFETDFSDCHRRFVVDEVISSLQSQGNKKVKVIHLALPARAGHSFFPLRGTSKTSSKKMTKKKSVKKIAKR